MKKSIIKKAVVYKVVSKYEITKNNKTQTVFKSSCGNRLGNHCLNYTLNVKTTPKIGKIFVFKSLSAAKNFNKKFNYQVLDQVEILKCETDESTIQPIHIRACVSGDDAFTVFWKSGISSAPRKISSNIYRKFCGKVGIDFKEDKHGILENMQTPRGSYVTDWVIPTEIV